MKREEIVNNIGYQLTRAAVDYIEKHEFADGMDCFEAGAEWMQETMIEKACEWLKLNAEDYVVTCYDKGELDSEGLLMDFRKAMEE